MKKNSKKTLAKIATDATILNWVLHQTALASAEVLIADYAFSQEQAAEFVRKMTRRFRENIGTADSVPPRPPANET